MYDQSRDYLKYPTYSLRPKGLPVIGDPEEEYRRAGNLQSQGAHAEALTVYSRLARLNHVDSQFQLGWCYTKGLGTEPDYTQAAYWYQKAAEQGHATAQNNLGWCYENGSGVEKDLALAVYWYYKAADQGHEQARNALRNIVDQRFPPEDKA